LSKTIVHGDRCEAKFCLVYPVNQIVRRVDKGKPVDHKYHVENYLNPFVNQIWKQT